MASAVIRQYRPGDENEINRGFNEVFNERRSLEEWFWKFRDDPCTSNRMVTVAAADGKIIGQYACLLIRFKYQDTAYPFAQPVDNFVHADFRGGTKGILRTMYDVQAEGMKDIPSPLGMGFPNPVYYVVGKHLLKYKDLGRMPVLFKRLNLRLALKRRMPWIPPPLLKAVSWLSGISFRLLMIGAQAKKTAGVRVRTIETFDQRVDKLWEKAGPLHKIIAIRDFKYLSWRYKKPGSNYKLVIAERGDELIGYAVMQIKANSFGTEGHLVDLFTDNTPGVDALLVKKVLSLCIGEKVDYALCWMLPDKPAFTTLAGLGFAERDAFQPVNIVYSIFDSGLVEDAFVKKPESWYLTMGDSDFY